MSSQFGNRIKVSLFGESHGAAIGVVVDGLPAGEAIDLDVLSQFMARRAPGQGTHTTARREADAVRVLLDDDAMRETFSKALEEETYDAQATLKTYEASVFS